MDMERNKLIRLFALLPLATVLTMCTDDMAERGLGYGEAHTPIALNVAFDQSEKADTRAADGLQNTGFLPTYQFLRLFADQNDDNYTQYETTYKPTAATTIAVQSGAAVPYFKAGGTAVNVYGWYPALDNNKSFTVQDDQSTQDNYVKSDLLLANKVQSTRNLGTGVVTPATLTFSHVMSKIVLNVTAGDGVTVNNVRLAGVKKTVAINDATKTALTLGSASGDAGEVTVHSTSFTSSSGKQTMAAVIPPQSVSGDFIKVNVAVGGSSRDVTFALGEAKTLATNQTYTLTLTVNKQNIGATLTISGWTASSSAVDIAPSTEGGGGLLSLDENIFDTTYSTTSPTLNVTATTDCSSVQATSTNTGVATVSVSGKVTTITAVHAGTAKVVISEVGGDDFGVVEVTVNKATTAVATAPTKKSGLNYNTSAQALINAGTATNGTIQYSTDGSSYDTTIPTGTNAGNYNVWYKVVAPNATDYTGDTDPVKLENINIAKIANTVSVSPTSLTIGGVSGTNSATVSRNGDGTITINTSNSSAASATEINQNTGVVTVTGGGTAGNAELTISVAEGTNYLAATNAATINVTTVADPGVPAADVTSTNISLGWYLAKNGKVYENKSDADGIGTGAVAAIAYIGTLDKYFDKFLAIALEDAAASYANWSTQLTAVNTWAGTHAVTIGSTTYNTGTTGSSKYDTVSSSFTSVTAAQTPPASLLKGWRMPSMTDINAAVNGLGAGNYATLRDWFSTHGGTNMQSSSYWSSSETNSSNAWFRYFDDGNWYGDNKARYDAYVRAVFAY